MAKKRRPNLVSALLLTGTVVLAGGTVALAINPVSAMMASDNTDPATKPVSVSARLAADSSPLASPSAAGSTVTASSAPTAPSSAPSTSSSDTTAAGAPSSSVAAPPAPAASSTVAKKSITYTVKPGDTLGGIAEWFDKHGFGAIYQANRAVIGNNPDLILPGQRITISGDVMSLGAQK